MKFVVNYSNPRDPTSRSHDLFAGSANLDASLDPADNPANKSWERDVGWMRIVTILIFCILASKTDAKIILRFNEHITPHARHLGDLLLISQKNNTWSRIQLDSQPEPGDRINKDKIIRWMNNKMGSFQYEWRGKKTAIVQQNTQSSGAELAKKAQLALFRKLKLHHFSRVELEAITTPKNSEFPVTEFKVDLPESYPPAKRICARLKHNKRTITVWFRVKAWKNVLVAHHQLKRHTPVHGYDFILEQRDIAGLKNTPCTKLTQTLWLKKSIIKKQILTRNNVTDIPQVQKGHTVQVKIQSNGISITTEAVAQNDGYAGQNIPMKNPKTNKYFIAMISGKNQVEIVV